MQTSGPSGKPRGCYACKAMKVKCDRTVPQCERCTRRGKQCPGYADESSLVFRNMNQYAEKKVKTRIEGRDQSSSNSTSEKLTPAHFAALQIAFPGDLGLLRSSSWNIPAPMSTDLRQVAVPRFFADYGKPSDVIADGSVYFLNDVLQQNGSQTYLIEALQAVAFVSLANQTGQGWLEMEARQLYGHSMLGAAHVLQTLPQAKNDALLAATFLFSYFESLVPKDSYKFWDPLHYKGRISLLLLRGDDQFRTNVGRRLFGAHYTLHMIKCLGSHIRPPDEAARWLSHFEGDPAQNMRMIGKLNLRNVRFCCDAQDLFDSPTQDNTWFMQMLQLIKSGVQLEEEYQAWGEATTGAYPYKQLKPSFPTAGRYPIHFYHDIHVAWLWNLFRSCRIHLLEVLKRCDFLLQAHSNTVAASGHGSIQEDASATIQDMVSDICSSVPFYMGEVDNKGNIVPTPTIIPLAGRYALWPFYMAMVSTEDGSETEHWLRSKLELISTLTGARLAGRYAMRERKDPWDIR